MKLSGFRWSGPLVFMFLCAVFSPIHPKANGLGSQTDLFGVPPAINPRDVIRTQDSQVVIQPLNPGEIVAGSILAPLADPKAPGECLLGDTQYMIYFPGGARTLVIELRGNQDVDVYVRRGSPIALEAGKLLADFKSDSPQNNERLSVPSANYSQLLEAGTYFIAITNCGPGAADYTVIWSILDPPAAEIVGLVPHGLEVGSVPAPEPGFCRIGPTQYFVFAYLDLCGDAFFWTVSINSDQNVNVYVRRDRPITVENGILMYDRVTESQAKQQQIGISQDTPGTGKFFIAVENCSFQPAGYTITSYAVVADGFPPFITTASLEGRLLVVGYFFTERGIVLLDDQPQPTVYGGMTNDFKDILIVKKAKRKIARHQTVRITIRRDDTCDSLPFTFTRR
jgi:hypothetical protein